MKQGGKFLLACAVTAALCAVAPAIAVAASKPSAKGGSSSTIRRNALRQFSGWVTATDKASVTVEKRGRNPRTMVFAKDAEMRTTGEVERDARVTVYYRDEDGRTIAHRVVVKQSAGRAAKATKATSGS